MLDNCKPHRSLSDRPTACMPMLYGLSGQGQQIEFWSSPSRLLSRLPSASASFRVIKALRPPLLYSGIGQLRGQLQEVCTAHRIHLATSETTRRHRGCSHCHDRWVVGTSALIARTLKSSACMSLRTVVQSEHAAWYDDSGGTCWWCVLVRCCRCRLIWPDLEDQCLTGCRPRPRCILGMQVTHTPRGRATPASGTRRTQHSEISRRQYRVGSRSQGCSQRSVRSIIT